QGLRSLHLGRLEEAAAKFEDALRADPDCAMAHWGLSRALHKSGQTADALAAAGKADEAAVTADSREQTLITSWTKYLKSAGQPDAEREKARKEVRMELDHAISLYPDDPEVWMLRGEVAGSPLRATPFYLAVLKLQPAHPLAKTWTPKPPPLPVLTPKPTEPVKPLAQKPQLFDGLGVLTHPVTTRNAEAQAFYEQGLRCFHSYVTPGRVKNSAAQSFTQAAVLDPTCAMAYWGLSLSSGEAMKPLDAANRALELALQHGTDKERRFAAARVLELSGAPKREEFLDALDGAIAAYPEDIELWIWRGKSAGGSPFGMATVESIPYQQAARRLRPEHPSPNHEMVHAYEGIDRPALGWLYTEGYRRSAPNMPHAHHMQAHLAMRLGRWEEAIDATRMSRKMSLAGFPELDPSHHIDILIRALAHEGRFSEAESEPKAYRDGLPWARLLQLKADGAALEQWAAKRRESNATDGFYIGALAQLERGDLAAVMPLMANVEEQWKKNPTNVYRYNEVKGRYLVQSGDVDGGLKLLREAAAKAVQDSGLHSWGGGSYQLEVWGEAALRARRWDEAEEAFHEALAHEHGSVLGALGMQVVWEQRGQPDRARHYADRAAAIWKDADAGALSRQLERLRKLGAGSMARGGLSQ
ncbi:MAG TPA: tetratricopeptide repeat protein, partial [Armatimonadota bacterium]|nr:tetratricopeptide repeat protein [Armatimonadota bacterium]